MFFSLMIFLPMAAHFLDLLILLRNPVPHWKVQESSLKGFQKGGQQIRDMGVRLESLAIVDSMTDDSLTFRD